MIKRRHRILKAVFIKICPVYDPFQRIVHTVIVKVAQYIIRHVGIDVPIEQVLFKVGKPVTVTVINHPVPD